MASLAMIRHGSQICKANQGAVSWTPGHSEIIERLPQIVWMDNTTWGEANLWSLDLANSRNSKTVVSSMTHLLAYANWLEKVGVQWWHFPARESERCLVRFRGALIKARDAGEIAPSTAAARMSSIVRFYRWVKEQGLLAEQWPTWSDRQIGIRIPDVFGFDRTLLVQSTDLAIPNRPVAGAFRLEGGVMPLTSIGARQVIEFARGHASQELTLMLRAGLATGMRLGSILDLKVTTLERAARDDVLGWHRIAIGPRANPIVATKYGVSGRVPVPSLLLDELLSYAYSTRRLLRQAKASKQNRDLLFLSRYGHPYNESNSRAVNVELMRLRRKASRLNTEVLQDFHFHRTRATFATVLMKCALSALPLVDAIQFVREACLHKNESTTMRYVRFIEATQAMAEASDAFTASFMGLLGEFPNDQ